MRRKRRLLRFLSYLLALFLIIFFAKVWLFPRMYVFGKTTDKKVYVALGFHTSLYHSYRVDSNDEAGFGKDIRIIRKIIETLDEKNKNGSNACAVWDIDNLFTLGEILPANAPDIIDNIKRRVVEGKDEVILMSYNNGLSSAMTEEELTASINLAITNPKGSGILDIFGAYTPIVRPQEMMISPGNYKIYKNLGIKAVALYYSAIPFDAFRVFVPPLSMEEALNPLTYTNKETGEKITIIPAYNQGDLIENTSLTKWARDIHREQIKGTIRNDVLIYINVDADDTFWNGYDLPFFLSWLPNTKGLSQLIDEVDALDYVEFTTLGGYLKGHKPIGKISFSQDLADGNFCGYDSWAQKTTSNEYWTAISEDRKNHEAVALVYETLNKKEVPPEVVLLLNKSYELRLRLLSTTHFGMAAPFLAKSREKVAEEISSNMLSFSRAAWEISKADLSKKLKNTRTPPISRKELHFIDSFMLLSPETSQGIMNFAFVTFDLSKLSVFDDAFYVLMPDKTIVSPIIVDILRDESNNVATLKLFIKNLKGQGGPYFLFGGPSDILPQPTFKTNAGAGMLTNGDITLEVSNDGIINAVYLKDIKKLDTKSFIPKIVYKVKENKIVEIFPKNLKVGVERNGSAGVARIRIFGDFDMPEIKSSHPGFIDYRFTLIDGMPYLFLDADITYPKTPKDDFIGGVATPTLLRRVDRGWYEVAPAELIVSSTTTPDKPFEITKRNFLGVETMYPVNYYTYAPENRNLASINNHITAEYVDCSVNGNGIAIALDNSITSNFAFSPMKLIYDAENNTSSMRINPFGAYFGPQYYPPTWGKRLGYEASILSGQQFYSSAPTYNGHHENFSLMIALYNGDQVPEGVKSEWINNLKNDLISYAHAPIAVSGGRMDIISWKKSDKSPTAPRGVIVACDGIDTYIIWDRASGKPRNYKVYLGTEKGKYERVLETPDTILKLPNLEKGKKYFVFVTAIYDYGKELGPEEEQTFIAGKITKIPKEGNLPLSLELKILFNGLIGFIN